MKKHKCNKQQDGATGREQRLGDSGETPDNEPPQEPTHREMNNGTDDDAGVRDTVREEQRVKNHLLISTS